MTLLSAARAIDRFAPFSLLPLALLLVAASPRQAAAQAEHPLEVAGGYAYMRDADINPDVHFPRGWFGSVGVDVAGPLAIAGGASGSYKSMSGLDVRVSASILTFVGGPRITLRSGRVAPFAEALFGRTRLASTYTVTEEQISYSRSWWATELGGGVAVRVAKRLATRVGLHAG
jgi:hypothetical protein